MLRLLAQPGSHSRETKHGWQWPSKGCGRVYARRLAGLVAEKPIGLIAFVSPVGSVLGAEVAIADGSLAAWVATPMTAAASVINDRARADVYGDGSAAVEPMAEDHRDRDVCRAMGGAALSLPGYRPRRACHDL